LNDLVDQEAGVRAIAEAMMGSSHPAEVAATSARVTRSILEHCADIVHALVTGAASESELAEVWAEGQRRHVSGARAVVRALEGLGALAEGLSARAATDIVAALADVSFALRLRDGYGWSLDHIERFIADATIRLVLKP
jgi:hypothetical protein